MRETVSEHILPGNGEPRPAMSLTKEETAQFKELVFREYGVRLTDDQAYEQATALITLFDVLLENHLAFGRQNDTITDTG